MKKEQIEILLLPKDFKGAFGEPRTCPVSRALRRHFNTINVSTAIFYSTVNGIRYYIKDGFYSEDYKFVKKQYANPNCDTGYYITIEKEQYEAF